MSTIMSLFLLLGTLVSPVSIQTTPPTTLTVTILPDAPPGTTVSPDVSPTALLTGTTGMVAFYAESPYRPVQIEISPARLGSFEWTKPLGLVYEASPLPPVIPLDWMTIKETDQLIEVQELYQSLMTPPGNRNFFDNFDLYLSDFTTAAEDYLNSNPNGDGAILVWMMAGHVHFLDSAVPEAEKGQEYEQAIQLLLKHHPERVAYILDDLTDLGLAINQVAHTNLGQADTELLIFISRNSTFTSERSRVYSLLQEGSQSWHFATLPTQYADGWDYFAQIQAITDMNKDGQVELLIELIHAYAGGPGLKLHLFAWEEGQWQDRLAWGPVEGNGWDAYYGRYWREDLDQDGKQEVAIHYFSGPPGGGNPTTMEIYQWDESTTAYTNTLSIGIQVCGYHAFAEAQRLRAAGDLQEAIPWYHEARRRWLAELEEPDSLCMNGPGRVDQREITQSYWWELTTRDEISGTNNVLSYAAIEPIAALEQFSTTLSVTRTVEQTRLNLFACYTPICDPIGRFYLTAIYREDGGLTCHTLVASEEEALTFYYSFWQEDEHTIRQVARWQCKGTHGPREISFTVTLENICQREDRYFQLAESRLINSDIRSYPRLFQLKEQLTPLTDCSGGQ